MSLSLFHCQVEKPVPAAAAVPQSSLHSARMLHVDTSSRHKMMIRAFFLAHPPETSCKAVNKQFGLSLGYHCSLSLHCHPWAEIREHHILLVAYPGCFHATYPEVGNLFMSRYPAICTFCKKKAFSKKDMFRAFSFCFTLHIMLLSMSCSIMLCSIM